MKKKMGYAKILVLTVIMFAAHTCYASILKRDTIPARPATADTSFQKRADSLLHLRNGTSARPDTARPGAVQRSATPQVDYYHSEKDSLRLIKQGAQARQPAVPKTRKTNYYAGKNFVIGLHTGLNFAKATNGSGDIISSPTTGFLGGIYYQQGLQLLGHRVELNYSRLGFHYNDNGNQGQIKNDYISLATMTTITIVRRAQIQLGTVEGFLINSTDTRGGGAGQASVISAFNRFDFGLAAGVEAYPYLGLLVGVRYNLGLTNLVRRPDNSVASYIPFYQTATSYNIHNGVLQIYVGYQLPL